MKLNFDIPTPDKCVTCRFADVKTPYMNTPIHFRCRINEMRIDLKTGLNGRDSRCPGIVEE